MEDALPSVVNVRVKSLQEGVFGDVEEAEGQGSGVITDASGLIVTNNHVVQCAVEVEALLNDGRELEGRVVGTEPSRDLAVVRVDSENLDPIELGRSGRLRLGDGAVALGFPSGSGVPTVTQGIVSGQGRSIEPQGGPRLEGLLQTDAAINPGNSGGALVDMTGRLLGINTAAAGAAAENIALRDSRGRGCPRRRGHPVREARLARRPGGIGGLGVGRGAGRGRARRARRRGTFSLTTGTPIPELEERFLGSLRACWQVLPKRQGFGTGRHHRGRRRGNQERGRPHRGSCPPLAGRRGDHRRGDPQGRRAIDVELAERPPEAEWNRQVCR